MVGVTIISARFTYKDLELKEMNLPEVTQLMRGRAGTGSELSQILDYCYYNHTPWSLQPQSWASA